MTLIVVLLLFYLHEVESNEGSKAVSSKELHMQLVWGEQSDAF